MSMTSAIGVGGFWRRVGAMLRKEFVQLRRDRVTLATGSPIGLPDLMRAIACRANSRARSIPRALAVPTVVHICLPSGLRATAAKAIGARDVRAGTLR